MLQIQYYRWNLCVLVYILLSSCNLNAQSLSAQVPDRVTEVFNHQEFREWPGGGSAQAELDPEEEKILLRAFSIAIPNETGTSRNMIVDSLAPNEEREIYTSTVEYCGFLENGDARSYIVTPLRLRSLIVGHFGGSELDTSSALGKTYSIQVSRNLPGTYSVSEGSRLSLKKILNVCNIPFFELERFVVDSCSGVKSCVQLPYNLIAAMLGKYRPEPIVQIATITPSATIHNDEKLFVVIISFRFGNEFYRESVRLQGNLAIKGNRITRLSLSGQSDFEDDFKNLSIKGSGEYTLSFERE